MEAAKAIEPAPPEQSPKHPASVASGLSSVDGRVRVLKGLARKLDQRIRDMHDKGTGYNTEAKELRETLKHIAAELEGRGDACSHESTLERIREILREEQ
jgi:hypothetical protein